MVENKTIHKLFHELWKIIELTSLLKVTYITGGTIRDLILGKEIKDIDIALKGDPFEIGRKFASTIGGSFVLLHEEFQTARVVKGEYTFDLTALHGDSISDDLLSRDFTINALAIPISILASGSETEDFQSKILTLLDKDITNGADLDSRIIDVSGGMDDIKNGVIRMISRDNLRADPLRLLRAFRFSAELGFRIESATLTTIDSLKTLIHKAAPERILFELRQILLSDQSSENIESMAERGILFEIIPELEDMKGVSQDDPHHLDVFDHTTVAYREVESIMNKLDQNLPYPSKFREYLEALQYRKAFLKLSVLLHDMGKPKTREVMPDGRITFYNHERMGTEMAENVCRRLKASRKESEFVETMVFNHLGILFLAERCRKKEVVRFLKNVHDDVYGLMILGLADIKAMGGTRADEREDQFLSSCKKIIKFYNEEFIPRVSLPKFITGRDLIDVFDLSPSPQFKEILAMIDENVLEGAIDTREKALLEVKRFLKEKTHG